MKSVYAVQFSCSSTVHILTCVKNICILIKQDIIYAITLKCMRFKELLFLNDNS